ncbi:2732_t:CDS:2 [Gigaspora rosea]|nr:2732_t:CDS:2 [Gigaspora rosea]
MLQEIKNGQRWDEDKTSTIRNCWYHTKILFADTNSDLQKDFCQIMDPILKDITNALRALDLPNSMQVEEYLAISEENIVYEIPSDDRIIQSLLKLSEQMTQQMMTWKIKMIALKSLLLVPIW